MPALGIPLRTLISGNAGTPGSGGATEAPAAPTGLMAFTVSDTQIDLTWFDNSDNESGFDLQYDTDSGFSSPTTVNPAENAESHSVTGLTANTIYYFRIRATNAIGDSAWSSTVTHATSNLTALSWSLELDASIGTYESNGGAASVNGGDVGYWEDQSGNGNHVEQTTAAKKPHLQTNIQNGLPVVRGDGSDDGMRTVNSLTLSSFTLTAMVIVRTVANGRIFYQYDGSDGWLLASTGQYGFYEISTSKFATFDAVVDVPVIVTLVRDATNSVLQVRQNGVLVGEDTNTVPSTAALFDLFAATASSAYANVDIGEVKLVNSVLSEADIQATEAELSATWGITLDKGTAIQWHLELDAALDTYESDGGPPSVDGGDVGYWKDQSGWGHHAQQTTADAKPHLQTNIQNSLPVIRMDGSDDYLATIHEVGLKRLTFVWVGIPRNASGFGRIGYQYDGSDGWSLIQGAGGAYEVEGNNVAWNEATDNPEIVVVTYDDGTLTLRRNGSQVGTAIASNPFPHTWDEIYFGSSLVPNQFANVDIGKYMIAPYVLTGDQITNLERELSVKWGITLNGDVYFPPVPLITPTYDGSGEAFHPSVYDAGEGNVWPSTGSPQHRYWMAMTPYPNTNDAYENPSILVSDDRETWTVPSGLTNPIDPKPGTDHNADTEILHGQDDKLYVYYIDTATTGYNMNVRSSSDGVTWSAETTLFNGSYAACPTVFYDGSQYIMIYVDAESTPYVLRYRTCATPDGTWSAESSLSISGTPSGTHPWNIFARKISDGSYLALIHFPPTTDPQKTGSLYWATSSNGTTWTVSDVEIDTGDYDFIAGTIYRSCFVEVGSGEYWVWFSGLDELIQEARKEARTGLKHATR